MQCETVYSLLKEIVYLARTGSHSDAASKLNTCLQELSPILTSGKLPQDYLNKLTYSLETMFLMQKQSDWVAVADVIEFEFSVLLKEASESTEK
jgi:hypothetical protein